MEQILRISEFIFNSFLHIWPYLLLTIPLSVLINLSGASKYITRAFGKNPLLSVFLATVIGAFSPFCSCGVIPVISSLLIGGVPIAPVMSFWIASPSMDPEIFFLSTSVVGWDLAVWRLVSTFIISLFAGYITHYASVKGFIGDNVLRSQNRKEKPVIHNSVLSSVWSTLRKKLTGIELLTMNRGALKKVCCKASPDPSAVNISCCVQAEINECNCTKRGNVLPEQQWMRVLNEIIKATVFVTKFMGIAFLITALITFYLPDNFLNGIVSMGPGLQVFTATLIGIPMYTSNLTALPIADGLIDLGLNKGAALSFLIAGATTTLPAMTAVWGIAKRRIFILYLSFVLIGSLLAGLCFNLFN